MPLTRRTILRFGLGGTALLALGGVGLGLMPSAVQEPPGPLRVLDARTWSILGVVCQRMCPGTGPRPSAADLDLASMIDATLATMHPGDAAEFRQALLLLENGLAGLLMDGRPTPFTRASPQVQDATLDAWRTSGLLVRRKAFLALRGLVMAAYWSHPATFPHSGYGGPPDFGQLGAPPDDLAALALEGRRRLGLVDEPSDPAGGPDAREPSELAATGSAG